MSRVLTVRELKELGRRLDDAAMSAQLGPFVLVQSPVARTPLDLSMRSTKVYRKRGNAQAASAVFDFEDLWVATLPPMRHDDRLVVGRGLECDIVIDDETVSKRHASLWWDGRGAVLEDLRSLNGTFVNGRRLSAPTAMQDNDALSFGEVQAFFLKVATLRRRMGHRFPSVATP